MLACVFSVPCNFRLKAGRDGLGKRNQILVPVEVCACEFLLMYTAQLRIRLSVLPMLRVVVCPGTSVFC